jgi:hypothetical protein
MDDDLCFVADDIVDLVWNMQHVGLNTPAPLARVLVPATLALLSVGVLFWGSLALRPVAVACAFAATAGFSYQAFRDQGIEASCTLRISFSLCSGCVAALVALTLLKVAVFAAGAAIGGSFAHLVMMTVPALPVGDSVGYWATLASAGLAGGVIVRCYSELIIDVATSALGAVGVAFSSFATCSGATGESLPRSPFAVLGSAAFAVGFVVQRRRRVRRPPSSSAASSSSAAPADGQTSRRRWW